MDKHTIEARIQAAIRPQLDQCDRLLDYYTEGLPREAWRPIALELGAAPDAIEVMHVWSSLGENLQLAIENIGAAVEATVEAVTSVFEPIVAWQDPKPLTLAGRRIASDHTSTP